MARSKRWLAEHAESIEACEARMTEPTEQEPVPGLYKVTFGNYGPRQGESLYVDAVGPEEALTRALGRCRFKDSSGSPGSRDISISLVQTPGAGRDVKDERPQPCGDSCGRSCGCYY